MKHITTFILFILTIQLFAQEEFPRVEKIVVQDKLFKGEIDKHPITIYLKYKQNSNYHAGVYSVEGWYYYEKINTKIPLTGLYDYPKLTLYHFDDTTISNELLSFSEMKRNHWEDMEYYENLKDYNEKFVLSESESFWLNESKKLKVKLDRDDLSILIEKEYLLIDSTTAFDLHNFGDWTWNFQLEAHNSGKYILKYELASRLHLMGQCGAGSEKGFLLLEFDQNNILISYEQFVYESCNNSITTDNQQVKSDGSIIYHCHDYLMNKKFELSVDIIKLKVEKKIVN